MNTIHQTAIVSPKAHLGDNVTIGPYSIVYDNCTIGAGSIIEAYCEIGYPTPRANGECLVVGDGARIRSHSIFYEGSSFGRGLVTGHRVTVRENTYAGDGLQLGTLCDIQGDCQIGDYVRFHSNVHIGQLTEIGNYIWIFPYVVVTNDPHPPSECRIGAKIHDYASIATMSVILPGVVIGEGVLIGAHSLVNKDIPPHKLALGSPAKVVCDTSNIKLKDGGGRSAYPWQNHFHRGYPADIVKVWIERTNPEKRE